MATSKGRVLVRLACECGHVGRMVIESSKGAHVVCGECYGREVEAAKLRRDGLIAVPLPRRAWMFGWVKGGKA